MEMHARRHCEAQMTPRTCSSVQGERVSLCQQIPLKVYPMTRPMLCTVLFVLLFPAYARSDTGDSLKVSVTAKDSLPHMRWHDRGDRIEKRFYPHLFGTLGLSTYAPNFDGLQSVIRQKQADYLSQGYTISAGRMAVTTSPIYWASIGIDFDKTIRMTLDGGLNFEEDSRIYAGSLGLFYLPQVVHTRTLQGFVGAGVVAFHAFVRARYSVPLRNSGTLEAFEMTAGKTGGFVRGGLEWEMAKQLSFNLDATYYLVSPAISSYGPGSVNFSGFSAGIRILFHFSGGATP